MATPFPFPSPHMQAFFQQSVATSSSNKTILLVCPSILASISLILSKMAQLNVS